MFSRAAPYVASVWGSVVSLLLLVSDTTMDFWWWYSFASLTFYLAVAVLALTRSNVRGAVRIVVLFVALVFAAAGGLSGLIFYGVALAALLWSAIRAPAVNSRRTALATPLS